MMGVQVRAMIKSETKYLVQVASLEEGIVLRRRNWNVAERNNNKNVRRESEHFLRL
jgi:hypothetical protein